MRADARRNYEKLLASAEAAFSRYGVDASLEDIARSAGVGIGTLYRHFPTRDALLEALMAERFEASRARAEELLHEPDPVRAVTAWLREFVQSSTTYRGLPASVAAVLNDPTSHLYASCHAMRAAAEQLLVRAQESGAIRTDVPPADVFLMASAVGWAGEQVTDPVRTERLLDLLVDGLRAPARSRT
jgi:AcrR family transcriptional regulator